MAVKHSRRDQPFTQGDGIFTGEDISLTFYVTDDDGDAVNVTGWTTQFKIEPGQGQAASVTVAGAVADGPNGVISVALTAANLTTAGAGKHWYVLARTDAGNARVLAFGDFVLQAR